MRAGGPSSPRYRPRRADYKGNPVNEYLKVYELGVDGVFSDFADTAVAARELFRLQAGGGEEE